MKKMVNGIAFLVVLLGLAVANLLYQPPLVSQSERRTLKTMPTFNLETLVSGKFMREFEAFALDNFVVRDDFRTIKARMLFYGYRQKDNNGIYLAGGHAAKLEQENLFAVAQAANKFNAMAAFLPDSVRLFYGIIPEKGYFLAAQNGYPVLDYAEIEKILAEKLPGMQAIDLKQVLTLDDYYRTDLHWNQEKLVGVTARLGAALGFSVGWNYRQTSHPFLGVYAGQLALPLPAEELTILENESTDGLLVSYLNPKTGGMVAGELYPLAELESIDPYNVYLGGAQPLIILENPAAEGERELVIFRDSFTSALAPLLTEAYGRVVLVDLRYISGRILSEYVTISSEADVLFLYGVQVLSNPEILLI